MIGTKVLTSLIIGVIAGMCAGEAIADQAPRYAHEGPALISNVRVIDGLGNDAVGNQDILIVDGKIKSIAAGGTLTAPRRRYHD